MRGTRAGVALVVGLALVVGGCSAGQPGAGSGSSAPVTSPGTGSAPGGGQWLRERGLDHGPAGFALPAGLVVQRTIDQPNVVTLVFAPDQTASVQRYLLDNAPALGLADVRSVEGSMTFSVAGWDGGLTSADDIAGLTLRRRA